jgi:hypothetical protein
MLICLWKLADRIEIISEGLADTAGCIAGITDVTAGTANDAVTKGGRFQRPVFNRPISSILLFS